MQDLGPVLYLALEDERDIDRRLSAVCNELQMITMKLNIHSWDNPAANRASVQEPIQNSVVGNPWPKGAE